MVATFCYSFNEVEPYDVCLNESSTRLSVKQMHRKLNQPATNKYSSELLDSYSDFFCPKLTGHASLLALFLTNPSRRAPFGKYRQQCARHNHLAGFTTFAIATIGTISYRHHQEYMFTNKKFYHYLEK